MIAIAINSSPHKENRNTVLILNPFLEGMKEAEADVELYFTSDFCQRRGPTSQNSRDQT